MNIALVSLDLIWESPEANLSRAQQHLKRVVESYSGIDIVVFPEFFTTGFSLNYETNEAQSERTLDWMSICSKEHNVALIASFPYKTPNGELYNRSVLTKPNGQSVGYNKRHLFSYRGEDKVFSKGSDIVVADYKGVRILLQICYDLRFPVWSRNVDLKYDIAINVANWPSVRASAIEPLARARAIENQCYYSFLNRSGDDPENSYNGERYFFDFFGEPIESVCKGTNFDIFSIDLKKLNRYREKFTPWRDSDKFLLID